MLSSSENDLSPCFGAMRPNTHQQIFHFPVPGTFGFIQRTFGAPPLWVGLGIMERSGGHPCP